MMNRKTKRISPPPPMHTTTTTNHLDQKVDNFSKWSKVFQMISPPNKKRRAFSALMSSQDWSSDEEDAEESEDEDSDDDDSIPATTPAPVSPVLRREKINNNHSLAKQKQLNRRAMYIPPNTVNIVSDGPKDNTHTFTLHRATMHKLRQNALPLLESLHLRKMLVTLQHQLHDTHLAQNMRSTEEEEDNVPLGALLNNNAKKPSLPPPFSREPKKMIVPPTASIKAFYSRRLPPQHHVSLPMQPKLHHHPFPMYIPPCYYINNNHQQSLYFPPPNTVQFIQPSPFVT